MTDNKPTGSPSPDPSGAGENELVAARIMDAPRELVFKAWTNADDLAQWWGPAGFTNTFHEFDLKPGGSWQFTMHGPNGANYPNKIVFGEITEPERIVLRHISNPQFQVTATFEDLGGKTRVTFRQLFENAAVFEQVKSYAEPGNEQNLDRLQAHLAKMSL